MNIIKHAFCLMELALNTITERLVTPVTSMLPLHCWVYHVRILAMIVCRFHSQAILGINFLLLIELLYHDRTVQAIQ